MGTNSTCRVASSLSALILLTYTKTSHLSLRMTTWPKTEGVFPLMRKKPLLVLQPTSWSTNIRLSNTKGTYVWSVRLGGHKSNTDNGVIRSVPSPSVSEWVSEPLKDRRWLGSFMSKLADKPDPDLSKPAGPSLCPCRRRAAQPRLLTAEPSHSG